MSELVARGTFQKNLGTGSQSITGLGFEPKFVMFYGVNRPALDVYDERSVWAYGFTDEAFDVAFSAWSEDNVATAVQRRWFREGYIHTIRYVGVGFTDSATFTSFDADGFTINWDSSDGASAVTIHYIAIGGDVNVKVGKFQTPTTSNTLVPVTGVGFEPSLLLFASVWNTGTSDETGPSSGRNNIPALGFTDGVNQGMNWITSGLTNPANTRRYQRTDRCFGIGSSTSVAVAMEGEIVSLDSDGFTVRVTTAFTSALNVYYVALGNVTAKVGAFLQPTTAGRQEVTGIGFQPGALLLTSINAPASTSVQTESRYSMGATDGVSQGGSWTGDQHNVSPTVTARITTASAILHMADPAAAHGSSTLNARAEFLEFIEDGFALDWTDVDATQREVLYLAFLGSPTGALIETLPATPVQSTTAKLRGRINPQGTPIDGWFVWGLDPEALTQDTIAQSIGSGTAYVGYNDTLTGLTPETTYYFRAVGSDGGSPSPNLFGQILSFTTRGEQTFIDGEVSFPLTFLELTNRDGDVKVFAEVDLNDPPAYHHGYKAPFVERFTTISRGLSDRDGQIEHLSFGAVFNVAGGQYFRALLDDPTLKYLTNRPLAEWFVDDEQRRIQGPARLAALGFVNDYAPRPNLGFELKGSDWLKKKFSRKRKAQQSWQPLITLEDFPNCPDDRVNTPAPLIYGPLGLTGADPVENVQVAFNAQPTAAPGSFALALVAGGRIAGVRKYYRVSQIVGGIESDQSATLTAVTDNTNKTIRASWTPSGSATAIYLYSSDKADFSQFAMVVLPGNATSYDDDTTPPNQDAKWLLGTDWVLGRRLNITYYVYAKLAGGLFSRPGTVTTHVMPLPVQGSGQVEQIWDLQTRDVDVTWDSHPLAVDGYLVLRHRSYYTNYLPRFDRQWDIGATSPETLTVNDDLVTRNTVTVPAGELIAAAAAGQAEAIDVGLVDTGSPNGELHALLICRQASTRVGNIYTPVTIQNVDGEDETTWEPLADSEYGVTWFAPDHPGWLFPNKYVDINGRRYTLIFTTVNPLPQQVLVDVDGVETDGDGEGELLRAIVDQRLHFIVNWIAPDTPYQSGAYLTAADTVFPHQPDIPLVDEASHTAAKLALAARLGHDYEGAGIIGPNGEFISATDALAQFHMSADVDQVFNRKGQDTISVEPIEPAADPDLISDVTSIQDNSYSIADQVQTAFYNILPYVHTRDYTGRTRTGWYGVGEERSQTSIDNYDQERESPRFELHFCRANTPAAAATIADVMARKRARYQDPRRTGTMIVPFSGLNYEPGSTATIDHIEGIGASGWVGREVRFTHHDVEPTDGFVRLDFYDLVKVFENQGSP